MYRDNTPERLQTPDLSGNRKSPCQYLTLPVSVNQGLRLKSSCRLETAEEEQFDLDPALGQDQPLRYVRRSESMNRRELVAAFVGLASEPLLSSSQASAPGDVPSGVSLIRLIANPNIFDGHRLRLAGFLDHNGIDRAVGLYVSELDGRNFIMSNSIDLRLEEDTVKKFIGRYVILEANFHAAKGFGSEYLNGFLDHISGLKIWGLGDKN
jgi:hypothetical protein